MSHFSKYLIAFIFLVATIAVAGQAKAAEVLLSRQAEEVVISAAVQADFAGSEAVISAPDATTVEIAVAGADFAVDGKRQLFRFEDAAIKTVSLSRDNGKGVVRFNVKQKNAALVADLIRITRADDHLFLAIPASIDATSPAISGTKTVAIAPGPTKNEAAAPGVVSEEVLKTASLTAGEGKKSPAKSAEKTPEPAKAQSEESMPIAVKDKRPESEIPVFADKAEVKKAAGSSLERLVITLFVICALLAAALFGLKRWAARRGKNVSTPTKINVLTQHHLGPKKSLAIIQVAGEAILIGITDQNISMLKTLALIDDEVPDLVPKNFADELDNEPTQDQVNEARRNLVEEGYEDDEETENFALRGLNDVRDMVTTRFSSRNAGSKNRSPRRDA